MLAVVVPPTNDFFALARYLVHGKTRPTPANRVAWTIAQNLPTDDPELAARFMTATAELSPRCRKAAYHAMIAWAAHERPTPETMQEIARKTLDLAGLSEHQALIMGHGDKPHPHLHMLINRVHPVTGKAWRTSHDYKMFDRIMRQLSDEYGFEYVPVHRFNPELTDEMPTKPNRRATRAARRGAATNRSQISKAASRRIGHDINEQVDRATSWDDVITAFADHGLSLEAKGTGLIVGTGTAYSKFSALGLTRTAKDMQKRFAARPVRSRPSQIAPRTWFTVDAVDIVRAMVGLGIADTSELRAAVTTAKEQRLAWMTNKPMLCQLLHQLRLNASTSLKPPERPRAAKARPHRARSRTTSHSR